MQNNDYASVVEQIKDKLDIVDVVSESVILKNAFIFCQPSKTNIQMFWLWRRWRCLFFYYENNRGKLQRCHKRIRDEIWH